MPLTINTNTAAATASQNLSRNNASLQKSLTRLSSGSRINRPSDDAGGLAVSMKLNASINRLKGVNNNIQNAVSFLEVQDGILQGAADILTRMGELKALNQDVLKNSSDKANYNAEFVSLQQQLYQIGNETFNGVSLFATTRTEDNQSAIFGGTAVQDNTVSVYTSERGSAGSVVSINKATLLSAVTFTSDSNDTAVAFANNNGATTKSFAANGSANTLNLADLGTSFFTTACSAAHSFCASAIASLSCFNARSSGVRHDQVDSERQSI